MNKSTVNFCPVPREQQPIYEYEQLKETWLFNWGFIPIGEYIRKIAWVSFWSLVLVSPLSMSIFTPTKQPLEFVLTCIIGMFCLTGLFLARIYLGWQYVTERLKRDRIFYEESGWYDGQTWLKPSSMIDRDRLIVSYEIEPIFARLHKTYGSLGLIIAACCLIWMLIA